MSVQKKAGAGAPAESREETPKRACEPGKPGMGVGARHCSCTPADFALMWASIRARSSAFPAPSISPMAMQSRKRPSTRSSALWAGRAIMMSPRAETTTAASVSVREYAIYAAFPLGVVRRMDLGQAVPVGQLAENQSSARSKLEVVTSPPAASRSNVLPSLKILVDRPDNDAPPSRLRVFVASAYVVARCRSCSRKVIMRSLVNGKLPACQYRAGKMPALDCRTARVKSRND